MLDSNASVCQPTTGTNAPIALFRFDVNLGSYAIGAQSVTISPVGHYAGKGRVSLRLAMSTRLASILRIQARVAIKVGVYSSDGSTHVMDIAMSDVRLSDAVLNDFTLDATDSGCLLVTISFDYESLSLVTADHQCNAAINRVA